MGVAGGGAVGDHGDGEVGGVGGEVEDLDVEDGGEAAEALGADAEGVDLLVDFDAELFDVGRVVTLRHAGFELLHVDVFHEGLLGEEHGFFGGAADADAEHAGRAPAGAHGGDGFEDPVDDGVGWVEHDELGFGFGAAAFGCDGDVEGVAGDEGDFDDAGGVVDGVLAGEGGVGEDAAAEFVVGSSQARRTPSSQSSCRDRVGELPTSSVRRTSRPSLRKMVTMPVSWQMGRWPSAHMRELTRICLIASLAAGDSSSE